MKFKYAFSNSNSKRVEKLLYCNLGLTGRNTANLSAKVRGNLEEATLNLL
jgi:hypothetical protein